MKFSVRFWMIVALLSSVVVACNRTEEPPASSANQSSALPSTEQPAAQPAQQEAAPEPAEPKPSRRPAPAPARAPASPSGVRAVTAPEPSASTRAAAPNTLAPPPPAPKPVEPPEVVSIPSGTSLTVVMIDPVGTDTSKPGDTFTASLGEAVVVNGKTVIAKGTKVQGRVETVDEPGRVKGKAALSLVLTQLMSKDKVYPLSTEPYTAEAESG